MAKEIKHVGKMANTGEKVAVVFRTVPGESDKALVIQTAQLSDDYHDALMSLIESDQAQQTNELGEIMFVRSFPDGRPMLRAMEADNRLRKVDTSNVKMTPLPTSEVILSDLNAMIAEQRGVAVDDLYTFVSGAPKKGDEVETVATAETIAEPVTESQPAGVLTDSDLAKSLRSQADAMYKEAARLRREADELDPPKKKTSKAKVEAEA